MRKAMDAKMSELRTKLKSTLEEHYKREQDFAIQKLEDAMSPYTRFVKTEKEKLEKYESKFKETANELHDMREELASLFKK